MFLIFIVTVLLIAITINSIRTKEESQKRLKLENEYKELEEKVLKDLGFPYFNVVPYYDEYVIVKSRQTLDKYDYIKFFSDNKEKINTAAIMIRKKNEVAATLKRFLENNEYKSNPQYNKIEDKINYVIKSTNAYRINVIYKSQKNIKLDEKVILVKQQHIDYIKNNSYLLMSKTEYNKLQKEKQKEELNKKHHEYYNKTNKIIDYANYNKEKLVLKGSKEQLDNLIIQLFDRTVNSIKKIKTIDSEEWKLIEDFIKHINSDIRKIVDKNQKICQYYDSTDFLKIKDTCEVLMSSQREFNEYINEKVQSISQLFGVRVVRSETINNDEYAYIRPYKKTITPFTAEVSAAVFASAENNPMEYVVKNFYPNKKMYPEQIQKLQLLLEELETLKEAKQIIENYKKEYQQYIVSVPDYIMEEDESGFYHRLGFANIDESAITIEYKFSYTSNGGMVQRSFTVPMTEETIVELIKKLENKLTTKEFVKEQRNLMTKKLREFIKKRDNFTCCICGNSIHKEPNLLLEIDHKIPLSKGGFTVEDNLQTLCWKCNRSKSNKII